MAFIINEHNNEMGVATPVEDLWGIEDDWTSDLEGDISVSLQKEYLDDIVDLRRKFTKRNLHLYNDKVPIYTTSFNRREYNIEIKKYVRNSIELSAILDIVYKYDTVGKIDAISQILLHRYIKYNKYAFWKSLDWVMCKNMYLGKHSDKFMCRHIKLAKSYQGKQHSYRIKKAGLIARRINAKHNRFYLLRDNAPNYEEVIDTLIMDITPDVTYIRPAKPKKYSWDDLTRLVSEFQPVPPPKPRNAYLLKKLQEIIKYLRSLRTNTAYDGQIEMLDLATEVQPEMEVERGDDLSDLHYNIRMKGKLIYNNKYQQWRMPNGDMHRIWLDPLIIHTYKGWYNRPQMMESEQPEQQKEAGPVVLSTIEQSDVELTKPVETDETWTKASTSDTLVDMPHSSKMEILAHRFVWKSDQAINTNLFELKLPVDALVGARGNSSVCKPNMNHPAAMLFGQYAYWKGDIKVRIHVNTTPFHIGNLIFSWYYAQDFDLRAKERDNVANSIQLPHVLYNASIGEDVVLTIPYMNYRSMLCTRTKVDDSLPLYMGTLRCHVLNPLTLDKVTQVDGYVHVSFLNATFTGICPRKDIVPEMLPTKSLVKMAEGALNLFDQATNMDKPPRPDVPVMYTPQFSDSFSTGRNDVNNVHSLRLDPRGQIQHPPGSSIRRDEMNLKWIARKWGLLRILDWTTSLASGASLLRLPLSPEFDFKEYFHVVVERAGKNFNAAVLPPLSAIATINAYNRGSVEYKFEIVNSRYHTGALLASFTPVIKDVTLCEAIQSYNTTLDVGNTHSYIFKIPYINERPYNPRFNREEGSTDAPILAPLGEVNLFVLNQLKNVSGTSDKIYVNVYIRAGEDFEFAVPVPPMYSVDLDNRYIPSKSFVYTAPGEKVIGLDSWRYMNQIPNLEIAVISKKGAPADDVAQYIGLKPFIVYLADFQRGADITSPFTVTYWDSTTGEQSPPSSLYPTYMCMVIVNGDKNTYKYATFFRDAVTAESYIRAHHSLVTSNDAYPDSPTVAQWKTFQPGVRYTYTCLANEASYREWKYENYTDLRWVEYINPFSTRLQPEMDEEVKADPTIATLANVKNGMKFYGEQFIDLKDYCRRYIPYYYTKISLLANQISSINIPITPIGLTLSTNNVLMSGSKQALIPYISSAYRFYRGSLRFKILINNADNSINNSIFYIQHKPDLVMNSRIVVEETVPANSINSLNAEKKLQSGYAYTAMSTSVNNGITIEIPSYIPTNLLMLQSPNYERVSEIIHYGMGVLNITNYCNQSTNDNYTVQMHYALGDDMEFSGFVGFPPMISLSELPMNSTNLIAEELLTMCVQPQMEEETEVESQGLVSKFKSYVGSFVSDSVLEHTRESLGLPVGGDNDSISVIIRDAIKKFGNEYKDVLVSIVSQIAHLIAHPDVTTYVTVLCTLLAHIGVHCFGKFAELVKYFQNLFTSKKEIVPQGADDDKTEISSIDSNKQSITEIILSLGASYYGKTVDFFKGMSMPDFTSKMFTNVRFGALTVNAIITMIKNLFNVIPAMWSWICSKCNFVGWIKNLFFDNKDFVMRWCKDVEFVTDPANISKVRSQCRYVYHVELLVMIGRDIMKKKTKLSIDTRYLTDLNSKLNSLYTQIQAYSMTAGTIGIDPFCICFHGESQVGKTEISQEVAAECLREIGYLTNEQLFYTRPLTGKHWDGVENQPVCIYDDFLQVQTDESIGELVGEFMLLKSSATFSPPRAHLDDKGKKYAPLIVLMTMNKPFARHTNVLSEPTAWMKRREVLIHVEFKAPAAYPNARKLTDLPKEELVKMDHVRFRIHKNNYTDDQCASETDYANIMVPKFATPTSVEPIKTDGVVALYEVNVLDYAQLKYYLRKKFNEKYLIIKDKYTKSLALLNSFRPSDDKEFEVNLEEYRKHIISTIECLNKREKETLKLVEGITKHLSCSKCGKSSVECICHLEAFNCSNVGSISTVVEAQMDDESPDFTNASEYLKMLENYLSELRVKKVNYITQNDATGILKILDKYQGKRVDLMPCHRGLIASSFASSPSSIEINLKRFLETPCIHMLYLFLEANSSGTDHTIILDYDEGNFYLVYDDKDYLVDFNACSCKNQMVIQPGGIRKLKKFYYEQCRIMNFPVDKLNIVLGLDDIVVKPKIETRYSKKMALKRKEWEAEFGKIKGSTWMNFLKKYCSMLGWIMTMSASITLLAYGVDKVLPSVKVRQDKLHTLRVLNKANAEVYASHVPEEDCITRGCEICGVNPQMAYSPETLRRKEVVKKVVGPKSIQGEMAVEIEQAIERALRRNYFFIEALTTSNTRTIARCLGLSGRYFIGIDHYFEKFASLPADTSFYYRTAQSTININIKEIKIVKIKNSALYLCELPVYIPSFKNILKYFVSKDLVYNLPRKIHLYETSLPTEFNAINTYNMIRYQDEATLHDTTLTVPGLVNSNNKTSVDWYWRYRTSGVGKCGSVITTTYNTTTPIIGIHIAGVKDGREGYAEVVVRETFENLINELSTSPRIVDREIEGQMFGNEMIRVNINPFLIKRALTGNIEFVGTVPSRYEYRPPTESKCMHSICFDQITKSTYDVPHLSHRDPRFEGSPMVNGCMHHTDPPKNFEKAELDIVFDDIKQFVLAKVKPQRQNIGPLTIEQAIIGIPHIANYDPMEFDTSEGFPFSSFRPKGAHDKKWLFDLTESESGYRLNAINDRLVQVMQDKMAQRKNGIIPFTVFTDCLKDLKLPKEKCHKTRIFSISPVDFTIQFRQMFYDFTIAFQETRFNIESAVGINVDSYEWHDMVQALIDNSSEFVCGDYSKFGPRLMSSCVLRFFDVICDWYEYHGDTSVENRLIRMCMAEEVAFSYHLMLNMIYMVYCGAPSGSPITTILNNGVNMAYIRYAYLKLLRQNINKQNKIKIKNVDDVKSLTLHSYYNNVRIFFYGDDLIMTVKPEILDWFNATNLSEVFRDYDIVFTDALKTGNVAKSTHVFSNETSFLKRNIRRHPKRFAFVAAMDKRAIEETCNWVFKGHDEPEASLGACEAMLLNAFGWGEEYYEDLRSRVFAFWRAYGEYPRIPSWVETDYRIYNM